ncbi:hypothetical protein KI387_028315, partial [Taxus chinensis]
STNHDTENYRLIIRFMMSLKLVCVRIVLQIIPRNKVNIMIIITIKGTLMEVVEVEVTMDDSKAEVTVVEEVNSHEEHAIH